MWPFFEKPFDRIIYTTNFVEPISDFLRLINKNNAIESTVFSLIASTEEATIQPQNFK